MQLGLIFRGAGLGLLLTPVTVASLSSLSGPEIAQGAGLTNLFRQLGGSFGIAIVNTFVTNMAQHHRSDLVSNLYSGNSFLSDRINGLAGVFHADGYSLSGAHNAAVASIERLVQDQSLTMAYDDAFQLIAAISFFAIPAALLFVRRGQPAKPAAGLDAGH